MAEEGEHSDMATTDSRPQTARKDSRKVPGGFGIDDVDDLSPSKGEFEDSIFANANAFAQNNRIPSLDPASLPSLPPPTDSSLLYSHSENGEGILDAADEKEIQRHLNDVESSFLPALSPIGMSGHKGADDTFLFDGARPTRRGSPLNAFATRNKNATISNNASCCVSNT
jgi:hypothetical protein